MKHFIHSVAAAISVFACLVSCADHESELLSANQSSNNQLRVVTHTREGEGASTPVASVYLFNSSNELVRTLQTDAAGDYTSASTSVKLPAGTYTLCAISPSDLSHFQLPDPMTPTSAISLASGQTMSDLLMATATATLSDGDAEQVDMTLQRKVLELSSITISLVPDDVTGVTASIAPFYSAIQFNGSYVDAHPSTCTFALTKNTDTGDWEAAPQQLAFPSKGVPTITVTFARSESDTHSYSFTAESALTANNKYTISGTYTEPLGVTLTGSITLQPWATNPTAVNFEFDEHNATSSTTPDPSTGGDDTADPPAVGQIYDGYYVVSVDEANNTAVLLSNNQKKGVTQAEYQNYLSSISKPQGATGNWRIPTVSECQVFLSDPTTPNVINDFHFCYNGEALSRIKAETSSEGTVTYSIFSTGFNNMIYLRPVIEISYE